ncbi:hypothetical protein C0V70_15265 [Bacteriovorax stolpii]|uniref:NodB homology domain-containing protein n=2 Tax=Bacteriovorax stolpii TaxID=960 RepID=A0A2K9NVA0_BACTC|nr:hypothetical protein C0V70_15265 [Bacteriovorax stolpii]
MTFTLSSNMHTKILFFILSFLTLQNTYANTCKSLNNDPLFKELLSDLKNQNVSCDGIKTHLSFDDGPNEKTSGLILDELNKRNIKATFFITTTNLLPGTPGLKEKQAILARELATGHTVASHGHEHNAYDMRITSSQEAGYTNAQRQEQIKKSMQLLDGATNGQFSGQEFRLFRFPYGRGAMPSQKEIEEMERTKKMVFSGDTYAEKLKEYRRMSPALQQIGEHGFSHIGWNHDSNDSSLPFTMPAENVFKSYVLNNLKNMCSPSVKTKISLFHDIKEVNTRAIPLIADLGQCLGVDFISPKEMMSTATLTNNDVVIKSKAIAQAPVQMADDLGKLINQLSNPGKQCAGAAIEKKVHAQAEKGCYSKYLNKTFGNCEGESSKCFEGKWYGADDPFIMLNCS